jgi:hypothetical protein
VKLRADLDFLDEFVDGIEIHEQVRILGRESEAEAGRGGKGRYARTRTMRSSVCDGRGRPKLGAADGSSARSRSYSCSGV